MNGRDRIIAAVRREQPDRVPTMEWAINKDVIRCIAGYDSDVRFISEYDIDGIAVPLIYRNEVIDDKHFKDEWGTVRINYGEYHVPVQFPVESIDDFKNMKIPDPDDELRYSKIIRVQKEIGDDIAIVPRVKDVFSIPRDLMGFESFLISFHLDPELVDELIAMSVENSIRIAKNLKSLGIEVIVIGDDIATNSGLLISPEMYRSRVLPHFNRLVRAFKNIGLLVIKHTDGDISEIVEDLINSGIDCLDPIDPLGNMDMGYMKRTYGNRIALKGNVDCVRTLVDKSEADVIWEVKQCILQGSIGGGHIISSSNTIHSGINPKNYMCFLQAIKKYGQYPLNLEELGKK